MSYSDTQLQVTEDIQAYTNPSWEMLSTPLEFTMYPGQNCCHTSVVTICRTCIWGWRKLCFYTGELLPSHRSMEKAAVSVSSISVWVCRIKNSGCTLYCPLNTRFLAKQGHGHFSGFDSAILPWVAGMLSITTGESHSWLRGYRIFS